MTQDYYWIPRDGSSVVDQITDTQEVIKNVSQQAFEEFERAKVSLEDSDDERARKDAVRSCLSALEAVVKEFGGDSDIKRVSKNLLLNEGYGSYWGGYCVE